MEKLKILNSKPIQENFLGFNALYQGYAGMGDDCGRILNEELCELEADRAKDQNLKIARTFYGWVNWDEEKKEFDWNHPDFLAFCKWVERMKVRGIDVAMNFGSIHDIMSQGWRGKSPFTVKDDLKASIDNYTAWVSENLRQIIELRGLTNLKYILYFTEPQHYGAQPIPKGAKDPYDVWYQASKGLEERLKADGWWDRVTVVGPQEVFPDDAPMMKWVKENHPDMVAAYSSHYYSWLVLDQNFHAPGKSEVYCFSVAGSRIYKDVTLKPNTKYTLSFEAKIKAQQPETLSGYVMGGLFKKNSMGMFTSGGNPTDRLGRYSTAIVEAARIPDDFGKFELEIQTGDDVNDALIGFFADVKPNGFLLILSDIILKESGSEKAVELNAFWRRFPDGSGHAKSGTQYSYFDYDIKTKKACLDEGDQFWYDEYNCLGYRVNDDIVKRPEHPRHGTDLAAVRLAILNNGLQNSFMWSLFDQQWPYNHTNNNDDFYDGDHRCGVMPALLRSKVPYPAYFAMRITSLVNGDENSKIFKGEHNGNVVGAMVTNPDGNKTVLLVNESGEQKEVEITFEEALNADLNCYIYNPETVEGEWCKEEIAPLKSDFTLSGVRDKIKATIPAFGVMAYSTK